MSGFWSTARGIAWRGLHLTYTNPPLLLPTIIFPLFFYVAFAGGLSSVGDVPGFDYPAGYDTFQFTFVLLQAAAFGGVFSGFGIASDFERGFGRRLLLASPRREAIVVGYAMSALGRFAVTGTALTVVALATGMRPTGSVGEYLAMALLAALVCIAAAWFAAGVAMRLKTIQAGPAMQMPVFLTLFLAPVFVPLDLVGGWVHSVATVNPVTALLEGGRDLLAGEHLDALLVFGLALALVVLFSLWALRGLRAAERTGG
ncbi:ABC transporter permease [Conexibacter sp. SYSU D00693]|uniref:ABC transporter permease n=1 Tax=Conexibacter sp. SYSU D00693 TaxID=2812560 RepID=UPI00196A32CC|nr:ABC transporter permease [Conexibacter sp. SYSU D00693]